MIWDSRIKEFFFSICHVCERAGARGESNPYDRSYAKVASLNGLTKQSINGFTGLKLDLHI